MNLVRIATPASPDFGTHWSILPTLSDRWGDLIDTNFDAKPFHDLEGNDALQKRLRAQMWDELSFIAWKDGQFGVLFESEFMTRESETDPRTLADYDPKPQEEVKADLLATFEQLQVQFPGVAFGVPDPGHVFAGRTALWAFVPDGALDEASRERLGRALLAGGKIAQGAPA